MPHDDIKKYTEANRIAWNEVAPYHQKGDRRDWEALFAQSGYSCLDAVISGHLRAIGVAGKAVAQVCCNNGRELLSVKNMGAGRCVGFDISDASIAWAERLAAASGIECEFTRSDVYAIPDTYASNFDIALITVGVLSWMPDVERERSNHRVATELRTGCFEIGEGARGACNYRACRVFN